MLFPGEIYFAVAFGIVFLANLFGNALVCVVVLRTKHLQNFTSILLVNLAVGDLVVGVVGFIHIVLALVEEHLQVEYSVLCESLSGVLFLNATGSIYTITVLAIDRYISIVKPIVRRNMVKKKHAKRLIPAIWLASALLIGPAFYFLNTHSYLTNHKKFICWQTFPQDAFPDVYKYFLFLFMYFFPMCVITFFYSKVYRHLWVHSSKTARPLPKSALLASRLRLTKVIASIILVLNICWLPWFVVELSASFGWIREYDVFRSEVIALFAAAHSCANPIVYSLQSANFRRHIRGLHER